MRIALYDTADGKIHDVKSLVFVGASAFNYAVVWRSQGHLGRNFAHWPHPVVVGISTNLFVREETVSWYAHAIPYRASRPFWCCFMRTLYKFCVFVSGRHCRYFEGKFRSLAVLFYALLS